MAIQPYYLNLGDERNCVHLKHLLWCSRCFEMGIMKRYKGVTYPLTCPKCFRTLDEHETAQFQEEAKIFYEKGLGEREACREKGLQFPDETRVFNLPYYGEEDRGFHTTYGFDLDY